MVLICSKCEARLQLDEAKAPSRPFTVRCPKCQGAIKVQPQQPPDAATAEEGQSRQKAPPIADRSAFERPVSAPLFKVVMEDSNAGSANPVSAGGLDEVAKLLAAALSHADTATTRSRGRKRPAWDRRKILVCASPAYRDAIALSLANLDYEVFVAENSAQALGRMREERMDIVILDANFDPVEQGVAFVTREVKLLRPSERRRLFFV